jgi:hypothetical protein
MSSTELSFTGVGGKSPPREMPSPRGSGRLTAVAGTAVARERTPAAARAARDLRVRLGRVFMIAFLR